ncbi:hypothetical protein ACFPAF_00740 [Hymenobacter endophyticus]|uniref:Outer membrane protein beta-barrel domain-containing protein n=1 Tax=Hymenobacter endophyticus TaxID=3076335 RepID=A0ABU3TBZ8_9BACT|nr:hypothetical protein [Hymenobacter endophyticus]MDU0368903.1 hypothetical protein [Hymenobacter endophyticus]
MQKYAIISLLLTLPAFTAAGQKIMVTGGYARVGEDSFTGAPAAGLVATLPVGRFLTGGVGFVAGRNRQQYQDFIPGFMGVGGRTITQYHNHLYSLYGFIGGRVQVGPRVEAVLGPSAGLYLVGAREWSDEVRAGFGLWSGLTYQRIQGSRFNLELLFHPRMLSHNAPVEDADFRFDGQRLFVWEAGVGISYNLRK